MRFVKIATKSPVVFSNISGIFFTLLLHNSKKCSNFAVANESLQTYYKKRLLALVLAYRNLVNFTIARNKKAVNALWDMTIPPQSVHAWTALFGGISYSAWALLAYSCCKVFPVPLTGE